VDASSTLRQLPMFAEFGDASLARLAARSVTRDYAAGHVLFNTGDPCRGLYVIETGRVRIYRTSPAGREQVLHIEGPGRPVAELPLFDGGPYPASAITDAESRLTFVPRAEFEALYRENPDVAQAVIRELGKRLRHLVQVTETLAFRDVAARLAHFLAGIAEVDGRLGEHGVEIVLDRTREELSFELGTARESVSRAFKQLAEKGLIEPFAGRRIRIPDVARLRTLGRPGERAHYE
jgi:CRP/FNR family transcriptional regulator, cyclic AMP receptor protein